MEETKTKNYCVFDTETTGLNKPFVYDIGYTIVNESGKILLKRNYLVSDIWNNLPLFATAYYNEKRPLYEEMMKNGEVYKHTFDWIINKMSQDFSYFEVKRAFAYNSNFDEGVFNFNCDWFKVFNPFDGINIIDIRGFAHNFIVDNDYKKFCEDNLLFTESGNYSTTAEAVYRYITKDTAFSESHTALDDSIIEKDILFHCVNKGASLENIYPVLSSIKRPIEKELTIKKNKEVVFSDTYTSIRINKDRTEINIK